MMMYANNISILCTPLGLHRGALPWLCPAQNMFTPGMVRGFPTYGFKPRLGTVRPISPLSYPRVIPLNSR